MQVQGKRIFLDADETMANRSVFVTTQVVLRSNRFSVSYNPRSCIWYEQFDLLRCCYRTENGVWRSGKLLAHLVTRFSGAIGIGRADIA